VSHVWQQASESRVCSCVSLLFLAAWFPQDISLIALTPLYVLLGILILLFADPIPVFFISGASVNIALLKKSQTHTNTPSLCQTRTHTELHTNPHTHKSTHPHRDLLQAANLSLSIDNIFKQVRLMRNRCIIVHTPCCICLIEPSCVYLLLTRIA